MPQQLVLEPLGLVTEPNKLGQIPAGALSVMQDCVERSPGVIENIKGWQTVVSVDSAGVAGGKLTNCMFAVPMDNNRVVVLYDNSGAWYYRWYDMSTGAAVYAEQPLNFSSAGIATYYDQKFLLTEQPGFSAVRHGLQTFVNCYNTVLVWDDPTGATLASSLVRPAGLQPPTFINAAINSSSVGNPIPAGTWAAYVVINTRMINGKKVVSAPSVALPGYAASGVSGNAMQLNVLLRAGDQQPGDTLEFYRTKSKPNGVASSPASYQVGEETGAEYQRSLSRTLTAADITAGFVNVLDATPDANLGEALYTNQAVGGAAAAAEVPPAVEYLSSYKGFLFGFSTTRPPTLTLRPTGTWGGFDSTESVSVVATGFGDMFTGGATVITGSWSSGSTTLNISAGIQYLTVGQGLSFTGAPVNSFITAVGVSTVTIAAPTTAPGAPGSAIAADDFFFTNNGSSNLNRSWSYFARFFQAGAVSSGGYSALRALSLKLPATTPSFLTAGAVGYTAQPTDGFQVYHRWLTEPRSQLGVASSKGKAWDPAIVDFNFSTPAYSLFSEQSLPRVFVWSEQDQPECWPFVNEDSFSRGTVGAIASTADALICFYSDGIWRLSGTGGSAGKGYDWRADPIASGITVAGSQATAVLLNKPYAMTSEGLIVISGTTIQNITQGRVHDQLATPPWDNGPYNAYNNNAAVFLVEDEEHDEILMREPSAAGGAMWIYNTHTDRLSQTTSHTEPCYGFYSRALRSPVIAGRDGSGGVGGEWTLKAQTGAYGNFSLTYQNIYADNPFAQRHWQTLNVSAETVDATITPTFNGVSGSSRTLDSNGRAGFEVPRNAPAIGNTMQIGLTVSTSVRTKLNGFAIDYRDHTDRRKTR